MLERGKMDRDLIEIVGIDSLVPRDHLLRQIDAAVNFDRIYEMVEPLYCEAVSYTHLDVYKRQGEEEIRNTALGDSNVMNYITGKDIKKVIVVKNRLVNIVAK